ncbi:topoisomerase, partial [Porphyromonas gingivalis]
STAKIQIIRYFFKHNAHVLWAFTTNQKTNSLVFSYVELTLKKDCTQNLLDAAPIY